MNLTQCHKQWASRPADQRFLSVRELSEYKRTLRACSRSAVVSSRQITAQPTPAGDIEIVGPSGAAYSANNWSFGQLAQRAAAPAGYLRTLPAEMAADCLNFGLKFSRDIEDVGLLLRKTEDEGSTLAAATGPQYGRIWDCDILAQLENSGLLEKFVVPGEFGRRVEITRENTTIYASDRDLFLFLADEENRINIPNRREGRDGSAARGFFLWNSEVGSATFGVSTFLFDYACSNRIVWGASDVKTVKLRHTSGAPDRFIEQVEPLMLAYSRGSAKPMEDAIALAQERRIDDVADFLARRFSKSQASTIAAVHLAEEGRPIETLWDAATGITAYARGVKYQDERVALERQAGQLLAA